MQPKSSISLFHFLLAILIAAVWGGSFIAIKKGLTSFPPFLFASLRFLLCALPFVFFVPRPTSWSSIFKIGFGFTLQFTCLFLGMKLGAPAGLSSLIMQSQVLLTALVATLFLKERLNIWQWGGIVIASVGISCIALRQNDLGQKTGLLMILLGSVGWMLANIFIKQSGAKNALHLMIWVSLVPPLPLLALSYGFERHLWMDVALQMQLSGILSLAFVAYGSTLLGYTLWGFLLRKYPASLVVPFSMLVPIFGMGFGWFLLGESFGWGTVGIAALIFGGICLVVFRIPIGVLNNQGTSREMERKAP